VEGVLMAPQKPANWEEIKDDNGEAIYGEYRAVLRLNRTQGSGQTQQNVRVNTNIINGNYDAYTTNFGAGDTLIYSYNASDNTIVVANQGIYEQIFTGQNSQQKLNFEKSIKESTLKLAEWNVGLSQTPQKNSELNELKNKPGYKSLANAASVNTDQPPPDTGSGQTNPRTTLNTEDFTKLEQIEADNKKTAWRGKIYRYPTKIDDNRQDFIKFEVYDYKTRRPSRENPLIQEKDRNLGSQIATIVLPIQPTIIDSNTVDWNGLGLNPVELAGYGLSTAGMTGGSNGNDFGEILGKLGNTITQDSNTKKAILLYLKQKAIGVNGLLSRFGGAIVNPNIELLFQGTQLRPFNFSFRLSPRDKDEAKQVKSIIRVFKEAMSAKTASGGIFLAAPNVFKIRYINGVTKDDHTSLNQIKTCALQSCSVDYTPDGSYMTFNNAESGYPMTSYNLSLQFQELEPVIDSDYKKFTDESTIGY
jgi:hypothetical protein